jgi:2-polyprenyl-3-methyl-5-hydroxy-6-metoxy-1,4-benzoquinol methylase
MLEPVTQEAVELYLRSITLSVGFLDRLKIRYRPLSFPFPGLISLVRPGERVGDIGCGSGQFCLLLARFAAPSFIYGIEIRQRLVDNARRLLELHRDVPHRVELYDGELFPDEVGTLDVVFLNDVLHHIPRESQEGFIRRLAARLKPGARLVVKEINGAGLLVYWNKLHDLLFAGEVGHELPRTTTSAWLVDCGLELVNSTMQRMITYDHYTVVGLKPPPSEPIIGSPA